MEVRPGYKLTELGEIPKDWAVRAVREMGEVVTGKALAVHGPGKPRPYLRTKNVFDGRIEVGDVLTMPMTDDQFAHFQVHPGDVLLNEGQSLELVGRCSIYSDEYGEPCAMQNQLLRFRARKGISAAFASLVFRRCQQTGVFARIALQTTSIAHLGGSRFERLRLAWPESEREQSAIAEALGDVDALLGGLDRLIDKKRDLKQAAMQQLLTGRTRLPGFSGEWEVKSLGHLGSTFGGLAGKVKADFGDGDARYITFMNVMTNVVIDHNAFERVCVGPSESQNAVRRGDLLFNGSSETPDEVAMCSVLAADFPNLYLNSFCFGFRLQEPAAADSLFLAYYLRSRSGRELIRSLAQGSTRYNISKTALLSAPFRLPSSPEQSAIAGVLSDMDDELAALKARRDKTRDLKQAMMQELLTGRIRLV